MDAAQSGPVGVIVRLVCGPGLIGAGKPHQCLVFVKLARVGVHLIGHIHGTVIAMRCPWLDEQIHMVAVIAKRALDVAIVVVQRVRPRLARFVHTAARRPSRVLNRHIQAIELHMALGVVTGFLLPLGRLRLVIEVAAGRFVGLLVDSG